MDLKEAKNQIEKAKDLEDLKRLRNKYLGKKGEIAALFASLKNLPQGKRKGAGQKANKMKKDVETLLSHKSRSFSNKKSVLDIDFTRPGVKPERGHIHLITQVQRDCTDIFRSMGFEIVRGPEVETEWYNFDALNFPKNHPARDMQDTFWLKDNPKKLPRTHTSPMQVRYMEKHKPPLRIVVPGRVFRNEATDMSHEAQFYQLEGLMVDENVSAANFKAIIEEFLKRFFKTDVAIRLRPGFFPFTEPSFEIDAKRKGGDWLELMGAGMVHPNVFKSAKLSNCQGFAFGVGLERLAMVKYGIKDMRMFYQSDLRFINQF